MGQPSWRIVYADSVVKDDIPALPKAIKLRIIKAINGKLLIDPIAFSKPLQYSLKNQRRLRVGDYRVLFALDIDGRLIRVTSIDHRKDVYG